MKPVWSSVKGLREILKTNNITEKRNGHPCLPAGRLTLAVRRSRYFVDGERISYGSFDKIGK
jgi:hypothetical protein